MTSTLLVLLLLTGGVALIVAGSRRGAGGTPGKTVRRGFQYAILYTLVTVAAHGLGDLLGRLFGKPLTLGESDPYYLAESVTFTVIGLPLAGALAWWTWRSHRANPEERESLLFAAYAIAATLTGVAMSASAAHGVLVALLAGEGINVDASGRLFPWVAVLVVHWHVARRLLHGMNAAHFLLGSILGLAYFAAGLRMTLDAAVERFRGEQIIVAGRTYDLATAGALLAIGAVVWGVYWLRHGARLPRTLGWHAYVLMLGVGGGLIMTLSGAGTLLWRALVEFLSKPSTPDHWMNWPQEFAAIVVGLTFWSYHRMIVAETGERRTAVNQVYLYLVAGIGLGAAAVGVRSVVVAFIEATTPSLQIAGSSRNTLLAGLTLLAIGVPLWVRHWIRGQRTRADETAGAPRRVYLVVVLGAAGVAGLVALIAGAATLVNDVVEGQVSAATLWVMRNHLAVLVAASAVAAYHGMILRADLRSGPAPAAPEGHRSIVLVGPADASAAKMVAAATGAEVLVYPTVGGGSWQLETALGDLGEGDWVLIARPDGVESIPIKTE